MMGLESSTKVKKLALRQPWFGLWHSFRFLEHYQGLFLSTEPGIVPKYQMVWPKSALLSIPPPKDNDEHNKDVYFLFQKAFDILLT